MELTLKQIAAWTQGCVAPEFADSAGPTKNIPGQQSVRGCTAGLNTALA